MFHDDDYERISEILEQEGFTEVSCRTYERKVDSDPETTERIKVMLSCIVLYIFNKEKDKSEDALTDGFLFEGEPLREYMVEVLIGLKLLRDRYYAKL